MSRFINGLFSRLHPLFDADGGAGSGSNGSEGDTGGTGAGEGSGTGDAGSRGEKTVPESEVQAKIDAAIKERLGREKKKTDGILKTLQAQIDELSGKPPAGGSGAGEGQPDEASKEALRQAQELLVKANAQMVSTAAQAEALKLGVDPKFVEDAVRLADLSKGLKEDGTIDSAVISKSIDEVLKRVPVFKASQEGAGSGGGFRVGGDGNQGGNKGNSAWGAKGGSGSDSGGTTKRWNRWNG